MESRASPRDHGRLNQLLQRPWISSCSSFSLGSFPWPPLRSSPSSSSSYTCGYCKREFRSAQALGGHMNVHRRERARLRQYCALSPISPRSHGAPLPNLNLPPPPPRADPAICSFFSTATTSALEVNMDVGGGGGVVVVEDDLDLELRLACSSV